MHFLPPTLQIIRNRIIQKDTLLLIRKHHLLPRPIQRPTRSLLPAHTTPLPRAPHSLQHTAIPPDVQILHVRIRIPRAREGGKVPGNQLRGEEVVGVAERGLVAVGEAEVAAVEAEVGEVWVAVGIAGFDGAGGETGEAEVVGVVARIEC